MIIAPERRRRSRGAATAACIYYGSCSTLRTVGWTLALAATVFVASYAPVLDLASAHSADLATGWMSLAIHTEEEDSVNSNSNSNMALSDAILTLPMIGAETVWLQLLEEGTRLLAEYTATTKQNDTSAGGNPSRKHTPPHPGVAVEVGMHRAVQCLQAATAGLSAHCVEPSPVSFRRVQAGVARQTANVPTVLSRVHLYHAAASSTSDGTVEFTGSGGTGDHVGHFDVWGMTAATASIDDPALLDKMGQVTLVSTIALDDILTQQLLPMEEETAFVVKIDTQGYEPTVLSGLTTSLARHKVQFLLMEYWPHGMDLLASTATTVSQTTTHTERACVAADALRLLLSHGYRLYALPPTAHPKAPAAALQALREEQGTSSGTSGSTMPRHDVEANCQWYYEWEDRFPSDEYKMGYWADVLAVAPTVDMSGAVTTVGRAVAEDLKAVAAASAVR